MNEYLYTTKSILLWCDARAHKTDSKRPKRAEDEPPSKRQQIEEGARRDKYRTEREAREQLLNPTT